jgi:hypothetical protein
LLSVLIKKGRGREGKEEKMEKKGKREGGYSLPFVEA